MKKNLFSTITLAMAINAMAQPSDPVSFTPPVRPSPLLQAVRDAFPKTNAPAGATNLASTNTSLVTPAMTNDSAAVLARLEAKRLAERLAMVTTSSNLPPSVPTNQLSVVSGESNVLRNINTLVDEHSSSLQRVADQLVALMDPTNKTVTLPFTNVQDRLGYIPATVATNDTTQAKAESLKRLLALNQQIQAERQATSNPVPPTVQLPVQAATNFAATPPPPANTFAYEQKSWVPQQPVVANPAVPLNYQVQAPPAVNYPIQPVNYPPSVVQYPVQYAYPTPTYYSYPTYDYYDYGYGYGYSLYIGGRYYWSAIPRAGYRPVYHDGYRPGWSPRGPAWQHGQVNQGQTGVSRSAQQNTRSAQPNTRSAQPNYNQPNVSRPAQPNRGSAQPNTRPVQPNTGGR